MLAGIWNWLLDIDWIALISGAALTTLGLGVRIVMREPLKAIASDARVIRWLWWLTPRRPFRGRWEVTWKVNSTRFAQVNVDAVPVYQLFSSVTFRTTAVLVDGSAEDCVFIGKLHERNLTGRWYNPEDEERGYYGVYQIKLHAGLKSGKGAWTGFSNDGNIQADELSMRRL